MGYLAEQHKKAVISCVELVLMRRSNTLYNLVVAKLDSLYNCSISDTYENPEYLRTALKYVYKEDYKSIIEEIKSELGELVNEGDISNFFKILESMSASLEPLLKCPKCGNIWEPDGYYTPSGLFLMSNDKCPKCSVKGMKYVRGTTNHNS